MFRHVFAFLLISTYYSSLGNPIETSTSKYLLSNSLTALASHCGNEFLSSHIMSRLSDCAVIAPPYSEKQFECLIFYDINTQLCAAAPTLALTAENTADINAVQNVNNLCNSAKDWVFTNLTDYVLYKNTADKVFKHPVTCGKICGVEEVMSENANFYCKYFKWGSELLKSRTSGSQRNVDDNAVVTSPALSEIVGQADNKPTLTAQNTNVITQTVVSDQPKGSAQASVPSTPLKTEESTKTDEKSHHEETSSIKLSSSSGAISEPQKSDETDVNVNKVNNHDGIEGNIPLKDEKPSAGSTEKKVETGKDVPSETGMDAPSGHKGQDNKESNLDNARLKSQEDPDDYQGNDPDDDKEGLDTQGGDDGDDPGEMDIKPDQIGNKNSANKIEYIIPPVNIDSSQRQDVYPNTIQDGFSEDDDHFFPFFLTAIILVVLLYVLYHNKNKVSKVVMGLILEGRQPGRRRNSRGHAYRRLDTLEQAMNANTPAPPSKIIY